MIRIHETFRLSPSPGPGPARRTFRLSSAAPVFRVPDVESTCRWYAERLGFAVTWLNGERESCGALLALDDVQLLIKPMHPDEACRRKLDKLPSTISLHITVTGLDAYYHRLGPCVRLLRPSQGRRHGVACLVVEDCNGMLMTLTEHEELDPAGP